jgi:thiol-disulfide isomerase/thioredoxin
LKDLGCNGQFKEDEMKEWLLAIIVALSAHSAHAQLKAGDLAHDNLGKDRSGQPVTVSMHRGKVVVVSFWASWCGPCLKELPVLENLQIAARDHLAVVAVNYKEDRAAFNAIARKLKNAEMTLTHDRTGTLAAPYKLQALPFMVLIRKNGTIASIHRGYSEEMLGSFVEEINGLLAE